MPAATAAQGFFPATSEYILEILLLTVLHIFLLLFLFLSLKIFTSGKNIL